ncbi:hypothetical protein [Micromonospora sp. KC213]|uniref:hypothetical protein n=1 Tax=Micromonospora sp. KC213 TaxID=2530378 RepID=UPI001044E94D|nr:hypothetical protein [Micromonospora sp. KC213]TDC33112.1 hypothetical protein E1166_26025 [Micromonospora sp. KC213]
MQHQTVPQTTIKQSDATEQPQPDYWLNLAEDIRQAADRIASLTGTTTYPVDVRLTVLGSGSTHQVDLTVPLIDRVAAAFGTSAAADHRREEYSAQGVVGHLRISAWTCIPAPEDPEKAALQARVAELEAQIAAGGTR